jgi:hypothetical protein
MLSKYEIISCVFFGLCLSIFLSGCLANNPASAGIQHAAVDNSQHSNIANAGRDNHKQDTADNYDSLVPNTRNVSLDCRNPDEYKFVVVENPTRKNGGEPLTSKDLNIVIGEEIIARIELPIPDWEAKNFSLNSVDKSKAGFEIKVEWGGGKYHYEIQFSFRCKGNKFYLYKVKNENYSTTDSDSGNFWDKKETRETRIEPNLPIEKFVMLDYLQ